MQQGVPRQFLIRRWAAALILGVLLLVLIGLRAPLRSQDAQAPPPEPDKPEQTEPDKPAPDPKVMAAVLEVRCAGAAAKVFVDGQWRGKTPAELPFRVMPNTPKTVRLSLRADGFQPHDVQVALQPGEWKTLEVKLARLATQSGNMVCIDPGHPSEVNLGMTVQNGTTENHINWVVALKLKPLLEQAGLKVVMTKQAEGEKVTNRRRAEIANAAGAQLMVRLHCDHAPSGSGSGFTLYYPDRPGAKGKDVGPPVLVCQMSRQAATLLHRSLAAGLKGVLRDNGMRTDTQSFIGGKQGALTGSIYSRVPVVTVEMVFLSNGKDAAYIKTEAGQQQMAKTLADGVIRFVQPTAK